MLLLSASKMNRKPLALAIVLLLVGLVPAAAIIGFCARMPCCSHAPSNHAAAVSAGRTDCCTTVACYDSPSAKLANRSAVANVVSAAPALVAVAAVPAAPVLTREVIDTSPPTTARQRLAALCVLRI